MYLTCEHYGKGNSVLHNIDVEALRYTSTKKCSCSFNLIETGERDDLWRLSISNGYHNHLPAGIQHGYGKVSR